MMLKFKKNSCNSEFKIKFIEMTKKTQIRTQSLQISRSILFTAKLLQAISLKLTTLFAAKLFTIPIKIQNSKDRIEILSNKKNLKKISYGFIQ